MTNAEWLEAMRLYAAYWPHQKPSDTTIAAWGNNLRSEPGHRIHQAIYDLANDREFAPGIAAIRQRCRDIAHNEHMAEPHKLPPATAPGGRAWATLPADEQAKWLAAARSQWPDWVPIADDSPTLVGHAAALHRADGQLPEPDAPQPAGRCNGCGGQMLLVDRDTSTAKCDRCHAEFVLRSAVDAHASWFDRGHREPYRHCGCGAALLAGFDPDGDQCRNCAPSRPQETTQ